MGFMTLSEMRAELDATTGDRGHSDSRLDLWTNWAYLDIASALELPELEDTTNTDTTNGQAYIAKPATAMKVLLVVDEDNNNLLRWVDKAEYFRNDRSTTGAPDKWTEIGEKIYLHPIPNAAIDELILFRKTVAELSVDGDTTILDASLDVAIVMLAAHYSYMAVGEDQRATVWFNRAASYLQSRITAGEIHLREPGLGPSTAMNEGQIISILGDRASGRVGS